MTQTVSERGYRVGDAVRLGGVGKKRVGVITWAGTYSVIADYELFCSVSLVEGHADEEEIKKEATPLRRKKSKQPKQLDLF